jgi:thioredoxin-related protein
LKKNRLKKYILLFIIIIACKAGFAQTDTSLLYLRFPIVPTFKLVNIADSSFFTKASLKKNKATVIIIFSPTCENCVEETKELKQKISLFKKAQIVMVSPLEYNYLRQFYNDNKIGNYPTITMGRDPGYFLGTFFKVRSLPSIFVYNKKGKFVKAFIGSTPVEEIAAAL